MINTRFIQEIPDIHHSLALLPLGVRLRCIRAGPQAGFPKSEPFRNVTKSVVGRDFTGILRKNCKISFEYALRNNIENDVGLGPRFWLVKNLKGNKISGRIRLRTHYSHISFHCITNILKVRYQVSSPASLRL